MAAKKTAKKTAAKPAAPGSTDAARKELARNNVRGALEIVCDLLDAKK